MAKNRVDDIKAVLSDFTFEELKIIEGYVSDTLNKILVNSLKIGTKVTIEGKGETEKEAEIYGVTADYYILKEGETVLKKQFTLNDFLSVEGKKRNR